MPDEETLKTDESSPPEETLNETSESSSLKESADLVSTTEYEDAEPPEEELKTEEDGKPEEEPEDKEDEKKVSDHVPYDRFQEMVSKNNELTEQMAELKAAKEKPPEQEPGYRNIALMTNDEINDEMSDEPLRFMANLASQVQHETIAAVEQLLSSREAKKLQETQQNGVKTTYESYAAANPDVSDMSSEIKTYIDNNPGHTQISAHMALTQEKRIADAVAKAVAETEKKKDKEHKTKTSARVLSAVPVKRGTGQVSPSLVDTKKHGGLTSVIAGRLAAMRRG